MSIDADLRNLAAKAEIISAKVMEKINATQELVMVTEFTRESNESHFKRSLQDRMSDIASWRWVFNDLVLRLEESLKTLQYELKGVKVITQRIKSERAHVKQMDKPRPPGRDGDVEIAMKEEMEYLKSQEKIFEELTQVVEKQIKLLTKTKKKIEDDILQKEETLNIEDAVGNISLKNSKDIPFKKRKNKEPSSLEIWENRCIALKNEGLSALSNTLLTKQQVRGARLQLNLATQAISNKVDSALRRRIHKTNFQLQELEWHLQESQKDLEALKSEQLNNEKSLLANMEQERVIEARLADRSYRPNGEHIRDHVDEKLRIELHRVKLFLNDLRGNLEEITSLQYYLEKSILHMNCLAEDLREAVRLDEEKLKQRVPEYGQSGGNSNEPNVERKNVPKDGESNSSKHIIVSAAKTSHNLDTIQEENEANNDDDEVDDYPFSD